MHTGGSGQHTNIMLDLPAEISSIAESDDTKTRVCDSHLVYLFTNVPRKKCQLRSVQCTINLFLFTFGLTRN